MPAQLVWAYPDHRQHGCYLVRGRGQVFHVEHEGEPCPLDVPLEKLVIPRRQGHVPTPLLVLNDCRRVVLETAGRKLAIYDTETRLSLPAGSLGDDDGLGTGMSQADDGRIWIVGALCGLSTIRLEDGRAIHAGPLDEAHGFRTSEGAEDAYWDGSAHSVSAFGDRVVVGGLYMGRVEILTPEGELIRAIGPTFRYQGREYRIGPEAEGVCLDRWQRIWVALDVGVIAVFNLEGTCLYVSSEEELVFHEGKAAGFHCPWGVDRRGWLWCHMGDAAYWIPELEPLDLAPSLAQAEDARTGLEPSLASGVGLQAATRVHEDGTELA